MSEFEQWFGGSKYTQVVYPNQKTKRIALDGWNAALSVLQVEQAAKIAELEAKLAEVEKVKPVIPCGGCGETDKNKRCLGCLHDFYHGQTLIARPNMEDLR